MKLFSNSIRNLQRDLLDTVVRRNPNLGLDKRAEEFVTLFEKHLPAESTILDIGGGWGFYREPLENRGHDVTVLDVVKPGIQRSPLIIYDGGRLPFPDKSFDVSMFITVLHHIPDLDAVIKEARRVTRSKIIVVEDLYHHQLGRWWTVCRDMIYNFEFFGHPRNFKKKTEWIRFFEKLGFGLLAQRNEYTWLAGLRILNGIFIFDCRHARSGDQRNLDAAAR